MNIHTKQIIKYDAPTIKAILLNDLPSHLRTIYPNGTKKGNSFYIGNIHGDKGDSLVISLSGQHKGRFTDFATAEHGDIFALFAYHFNLDTSTQFKALLQRLSEYLGLSQSETKPLSQAEIQAIKKRQEQARLQAVEAEKQEQLEIRNKIEKAKRTRAYSKIITSDNLRVQSYLKARLIPFHSWTDTIRFIPEYYHAGLQVHLPAIACDITNAITNEFQGLEINYIPNVILSTASEYANWFKERNTYKRNTVGIKKGGIIRILDNPVKRTLAIFEGYADGLSLAFHNRELQIIKEGTPNIWVTMGNNAENIDLPLGRYETVYICADSDNAGEKLVDCFRKKYQGHSITIKELTFDGVKDCNEYIINRKEAIYDIEKLNNLKLELEVKTFENNLLNRKRPNEGIIQSL